MNGWLRALILVPALSAQVRELNPPVPEGSGRYFLAPVPRKSVYAVRADGRLGTPVTIGQTIARRSAGFPQIVLIKTSLIIASRTDRVRVSTFPLGTL